MPEFSWEETLYLRRHYVGKSCQLHFGISPLKITKASKQYMYDDKGNEYLDCINSVSHVGHCHPHVVAEGQEQMAKLNTNFGFLSDEMSIYAKRLVETMPERLSACYFVNSGSEANDLAMRIAKFVSGMDGIVCIENTYHGNLSSLIDISPLKLKRLGVEKKDHVHILPCPDVYRGKYQEGVDSDPGTLYIEEAEAMIAQLVASGRRIAAFISEPLLTHAGMIVPPKGYLKRIYSLVRQQGGLCIAVEVQTGLGRIGDVWWGFQSQDVIPDIVTVGKPLGNGHPMAAVITTQEISAQFTEFASTFGGNPVSCVIGLAVLRVIENEKFISSAHNVGKYLIEHATALKEKHKIIGDVRGMGMWIGIDIVVDRVSKRPSRLQAEMIAYRMKQKRIIIANEGPSSNVMMITPPMCFTCENAQRLLKALDEVITDVEGDLTAASDDRRLTNFSYYDFIDAERVNVPVDVLVLTAGEAAEREAKRELNEDALPLENKYVRLQAGDKYPPVDRYEALD